VLPTEKYDVTRRVARAEIDFHRLVAELHGVAVVEPAFRREGFGVRKTEALSLRGQLIDPERIFAMRSLYLYTVMVRERLGAAAMIEMAVREKNLVDGHALAFDFRDDPFDVATRIDDGGALGRFADHDRAVLLKGRYGNENDFHMTHVDARGPVKTFIVPVRPRVRRQRAPRRLCSKKRQFLRS